jgi:hypothetical protein
MKGPGAQIARSDPKEIFPLILKPDGPGHLEGARLFQFGDDFEADPPQAETREIHHRQDEDRKAHDPQNNLYINRHMTIFILPEARIPRIRILCIAAR